MKKKCYFSFFLIFSLLLFTSSSFIFADSFAPAPGEQIKSNIQNEFKLKYMGSLNVLKSEYGLGDTENFENAQISSGTAYYKISDAANSSELVFAGYIFSIKLNNVAVGTIFSNNDSGSWEIFNISNNVNYEQPLLAAQSSLKDGEDVKLVSDIRYGINALYISGITGERILDLNSSNAKSSSLRAENTISKSVFDEKIKSIKENRAASPTKDGLLQMGSGQVDFTKSEDASSNKLSVILLLCGVILIIPVFLILRKKEDARS
ncbi:hypothetical protein [Paenibacillus sp. BAC0078]